MQVGTIVLAGVGAIYFPMVLGGVMRWSTVVLNAKFGLAGFNVVLMTRMWIYE